MASLSFEIGRPNQYDGLPWQVYLTSPAAGQDSHLCLPVPTAVPGQVKKDVHSAYCTCQALMCHDHDCGKHHAGCSRDGTQEVHQSYQC